MVTCIICCLTLSPAPLLCTPPPLCCALLCMHAGDNERVARSVAVAVGLREDQFHAGTSPEQKLQYVMQYRYKM